MKFKQFLESKITGSIRNKINDKLFEMNKYRWVSPGVFVNEIEKFLNSFGIRILENMPQEEGGEGGIIHWGGKEGRTNLNLVMNGKEVKHWLVITWLKGERDNQYEINAYIS